MQTVLSPLKVDGVTFVHFCIFVTVAGKTDHFVIISDFEIMVPRCSVHFALHNCAVQFVIDGGTGRKNYP